MIAPNIQKNQWVLGDPVTYRWWVLPRGDAIHFRIDEELANSGFDSDFAYVMPIIALPSEVVEIRAGKIYINGQLLEADYLPSLPPKKFDDIQIEIPPNRYLVLGEDPKIRGYFLKGFISKEPIVRRVVFQWGGEP